MFEKLIKLDLEEEYAIGNPYCSHPFVILGGGAILIFDELQKVQEQDFDIYKFSAYFAEKYGVEQNIALEDIKLVIQSLQYKEEEEQAGEKNIWSYVKI